MSAYSQDNAAGLRQRFAAQPCFTVRDAAVYAGRLKQDSTTVHFLYVCPVTQKTVKAFTSLRACQKPDKRSIMDINGQSHISIYKALA